MPKHSTTTRKFQHHKPKHLYQEVHGKKQRWYKTPGGPLPGLTTVLKATSDRFYPKMTDRSPIERGQHVHSCLQVKLSGLVPEVNPRWRPWYDSLLPAFGHLSRPLLVESAVYYRVPSRPSEGYSGTLDLLAEWDGELAIVDWKTAGKRKTDKEVRDYELQVAGYAKAVECVHGIRPNIGVVAIGYGDGDGADFRVLSTAEMADAWKEFVGRLQAFWVGVRS